MADESIRSLIATLGFEVDTTGADQFDARFKKLEGTAGLIAANLKKFIPGLSDQKAGFLSGILLGKSIRKGVRDGLVIDKKRGFARFQTSLLAGLAGAFRVARLAAIAGAAAITAGLFLSVLKFKDVEEATRSLDFQARVKGLDFSKILKDLELIRNEMGVIEKLDMFQAIEVGLKKTGGFEFVSKNLELLTKIATGMNMTLADTVDVFGTFIQTGTNITELEKFGFFFRKQTEAIQKAATGFGPLSEAVRAGLLQQFLTGIEPLASEVFKEFEKSFSGTGAKFNVFFADLQELVGSEAAPLILTGLKATGFDPATLQEDLRKFKEDPLGEFKDVGNFFKSLIDRARESGSDINPLKSFKSFLGNLKGSRTRRLKSEQRLQGGETPLTQSKLEINLSVDVDENKIAEISMRANGEEIKNAQKIVLTQTRIIGV